ncbi:MAG: AmmeMemoRadiSam system protein B [Candidatus Eisenbacteria bacterium]|nr:AmmeMemoRadiSam system protein B [Candidatus Eisenbacteria bacterium]
MGRNSAGADALDPRDACLYYIMVHPATRGRQGNLRKARSPLATAEPFCLGWGLIEGGEMGERRQFREPAVAGAFYPARPDLLRERLCAYLDGEPTLKPRRPAALISPHAGYDYSGAVAGRAYRELRDRAPEAVIVLGPSHYDLFKGTTYWPGRGYRTPLGEVEHPAGLAELLESADAGIRADHLGHREEHSIEVQLPFLQQIAPGAPVLPLAVSDDSPERCIRLGEALAGAMRDRSILLVASTDLYHGNSLRACRETDARTLAALQRNDSEELAGGFASGEFQACGRGPILAVLEACRRTGATEVRLLARTNSAEVTGGAGGYVVGYAALAIVDSP